MDYDDPTPCPECGAEDAEYGQHEPGCPSGYPTREEYNPPTTRPDGTPLTTDDVAVPAPEEVVAYIGDRIMVRYCSHPDGHAPADCPDRIGDRPAYRPEPQSYGPRYCLNCQLDPSEHVEGRWCPEWRLRQLAGDR
jgi:hypothetical protein